ncbi:hypothetical protein HanRHA438_Chr15g0700741 [Helianthus annuus]|nr:hypothetical protein HanRHA438_Chr15g0700741 [Helianthus annuus]
MGSDRKIQAGRVRVEGPLTRAASASQIQKMRTEALFAVLTALGAIMSSMGAP